MKLIIDGRELRAIRPGQARVSDLIRLQEESGLKLKELQDLSRKSDLMAVVVVSFLSQHNAGLRPKWADLIAVSMDDFERVAGEIVTEPGDLAREADAEGEGDDDTDPRLAVDETRDDADAATAPIGD